MPVLQKYGLAGSDRKLCAYEIILTEPMHRWKVAWESARKAANVPCCFHDLRQHAESRIMPTAYRNTAAGGARAVL
jgi:hypothetical protein